MSQASDSIDRINSSRRAALMRASALGAGMVAASTSVPRPTHMFRSTQTDFT